MCKNYTASEAFEGFMESASPIQTTGMFIVYSVAVAGFFAAIGAIGVSTENEVKINELKDNLKHANKKIEAQQDAFNAARELIAINSNISTDVMEERDSAMRRIKEMENEPPVDMMAPVLGGVTYGNNRPTAGEIRETSDGKPYQFMGKWYPYEGPK